MSLVHRYERDPSPPTVTQFRRDLGRRAVLPAAALLAGNVAVGWTIVGPLDELPAEEVVNETLVDARTPVMDAVTQVWSNLGGGHVVVITAVLVAAAVWWRTRQWWLAVVPAIALSLQSAVFTVASFLVGRPRPEVPQLGVSPPTQGFPSGHTSAATALYLALALLAQRIRNPVARRLVTAVLLVIPLLVAFSRIYRGWHHPSDVVVGLVNGTVCAWLAWRYLRRRDRDPRTDGPDDRRPETDAGALPGSGGPGRGPVVSTRRDVRGPGRSRRTRRSRAP